MSERSSSPDLGATAEALLGAFPIPERDWESDARSIEARLSKTGPLDELLLAAPLPPEPGEPGAVSATATPLTHSGVRPQSLTELARRSVEKKQAEAREIARTSFAIAADAKPIPQRPPSPAGAVAPRSSAASARASVSAPPRSESAANAWAKFALGVPLLALAAATVLWLRRPAPPAPVANNALPSVTGEATSAHGASAANAPLAPSNEPSAPRGIDPSTLANEAATSASDSSRAPAAAAATAEASLPPRSTASGKVLFGGREPVGFTAARTNDQKKPVDQGLPPDPALRPADSSGGELPAKPSSGAVQAALGAVLSGARHCVAGDDGPSSAVVHFGSNGHVQSVVVSGPAADKASGACIQGQLSKARVQPFAASDFSVNATIRPD